VARALQFLRDDSLSFLFLSTDALYTEKPHQSVVAHSVNEPRASTKFSILAMAIGYSLCYT